MKRFVIMFLMVVVGIEVNVFAVQPNADEILRFSAKKYAQLKGYHGRFRRMVDPGYNKVDIEGKIVFKTSDKMKMETTSIKGGRGTYRQIVVWDGKKIWQENRGYSKKVSRIIRFEIPQVKSYLENSLSYLSSIDYTPNFYFSLTQLESLRELYRFSFQGKKNLQGKEVYLLEGKIKKEFAAQIDKEVCRYLLYC